MAFMKRALVTGASGFIGSHLVALLHEKDLEIWASYHHTKRHFPFNVHWVRADLTRAEEATQLVQQSRPDFVFHLAGQAAPWKSWSQPGRTLQLNAAASIFLLEGIVRFAPQARVVLISSAQVYGATFFEKRRVSESDPTNPVNPYGGSKLLMEIAALNFVRSHGLSIVIARAFNQIGPGQNSGYVFPDFCRQIAFMEKKKKPSVLKVGNLQITRDFIHVRDSVPAYYLLARRGKPGGIYNIGSGEGIQLSDALDFLVRESRVRFRVKVVPSKLRRNDLPCAILDSLKLKRLGWRPEESIWNALRELLQEWREKVS